MKARKRHVVEQEALGRCYGASKAPRLTTFPFEGTVEGSPSKLPASTNLLPFTSLKKPENGREPSAWRGPRAIASSID